MIIKKAGDSHPLPLFDLIEIVQLGSSSLNVRVPEIIVETMLWRDMISSRTAAYMWIMMKITMAHMPR